MSILDKIIKFRYIFYMNNKIIVFLMKFLICSFFAVCLFAACNPPDEPDNENQTKVVFDNTNGICTAVVYDTPNRADSSRIAIVYAGMKSAEIKAFPGDNAYFISYIINIKDTNNFTFGYTPVIGNDQVYTDIFAEQVNNVLIPHISATVSNPDTLLSNSNSYIIIRNNSQFQASLLRGGMTGGQAVLQPDNISGTNIDAGVQAHFTISGDQNDVSAHQLRGSSTFFNFPSDLINFEIGYVYIFNFNGINISLENRIPLKVENILDTSIPILSESFENATHLFTIENGTQTNKWHVGTAITAGGSAKAAYISNDNGAKNAYTAGNASVVHMHAEVTFPSTDRPFMLSFDLRVQGEKDDYFAVFLTDDSYAPSAGVMPPESARLGKYSERGSNWSNIQINNIPVSYAGTTKRLIFTWTNDRIKSNQPPAAVDNIVLR